MSTSQSSPSSLCPFHPKRSYPCSRPLLQARRLVTQTFLRCSPGQERPSTINPKVARTSATTANRSQPLVQPRPHHAAAAYTTAKFHATSQQTWARPSPTWLREVPTLTFLYELGQLTPFSLPAYAPCVSHNNTIGLIRQNITRLEVGCIFNATGGSLIGGDGVDGANHRAAEPPSFSRNVRS